jgi:hypothetical protein
VTVNLRPALAGTAYFREENTKKGRPDMANKRSDQMATTVDSLKPYVERALKDDEFRDHVREALVTARGIYGDLSKERTVGKSARKLATDKDVQESLRRALEEIGNAANTMQSKGKKKKHKRGRKLLVAGIVVGALYNPWTGPQTRQWLLDKIAGDDELAPLDAEVGEPTPSPAAAVATNGGESTDSE